MEKLNNNKRYNSFVGFFKEKYGARLQKIVLDAGFTCPNRDGSKGIGGCTFCDNAAFHPGYSHPKLSIWEQIDEGILFHKFRYRNTGGYLAYFQSYSNTYANLDRLKELYESALNHPSVVGIVIGTRPDCVDEEKIKYISALQEGQVLKDWTRKIGDKTLDKPIIIIEFGIESCYDKTLIRVNRGHSFQDAITATELCKKYHIDCGAHFILGLPGESKEMLLQQCEKINKLPIRSVKFHQLQIVKGTIMEKEYATRPEDFLKFSLDEYLDFFVDILENLRPDLYIERFAGEVPPRFVNDTPWGLVRNVELLRLLDSKLEERNSYQGKNYYE